MAIITDETEIKLNDWSEEDYEVDVSSLIAQDTRHATSNNSMSNTMQHFGIYL